MEWTEEGKYHLNELPWKGRSIEGGFKIGSSGV